MLLPLYAAEVVVYLVMAIRYSIRSSSLGIAVQVPNFSFCAQNVTSLVLPKVLNSIQLALSGLMFLFIVFRFTKESVQMYRAANRIQLGRYVILFTREGISYFLAIVTFSLVDFLAIIGVPLSIWWMLPEYIPVFTLVPRFALSLRALYARDAQGIRASHIDTGFGFTSDHGAIENTMMFADADRSETQDEGMAMEESDIRGTGSTA